MAGVSIATVCHYRQRWNIPSYRSTLAPGAESAARAVKPTESSAALSVAPVALTGQQGFSVTILTDAGREKHITIADDIVSAARRASKAARGKVVEIVHLGPAIGA